MALVVKDRVKEATTTSGTGTLTLSGAVAGFQAFASALSDGDTTYYAIFESSSGAWEVGLGTWATGSSTLARTAVFDSSSGGSAISLSGSGAEVFITQPASKAAYFDGSGDLTLNQDPTAALQAATKQYVDTIAAAGIHYHDPVRVEKEGNLTATYDNGASGVGATLTNSGTQAALVIDGVTLSTNDRVLVYEQTDASQNGIYTVTNTGSASTNWVLTRATDADSYGPSDPDALGQGDAFFVQEGAAGAGETYVMNTEGTITFGTTNITFSQFSSVQVYSAGAGLTLTGTTFAAGAGTGVTVNANDIAIGQDVGTSADVTFNTVTADLTGDVTGNASTASALQTARNIALTGAVTGSTSFDGSGNVSITTTATSDPTITLGGDLSGSATLTNLGNATLTATINANSVALGTDTTGDYVASVVAGTAIDVTGSGGEGSAATVNLDLSELSTSTTDGDGDFFVVVDAANAQRKLTKGNINISGFNNDAGYTTNVGDITGVTAGNALTGGGTSGTVTLNHADTSTQGSVNNSNGTVIQDVTLDTYGHVTGLTSYNLDNRYYTETEVNNTFAPLANPNFTGAVDVSNRLTIGAAERVTANGLEISGGTSSMIMTVQDGSGRIQWRWNASSGVTPTYLVSGEQSARYEILDVTQPGDALWRVDHAAAGTAGAAISYTNILSLGTTTFSYNSNTVWHAGNDGAGSGLDADLLDGQHGSYYYSPANAPDPTLTLAGDATGSATFTNLGNATLTVTVADDSHNHIISNVDGLQTALDGKLSTSGKAADSNLLDGIDSTGFTDTYASSYTYKNASDLGYVKTSLSGRFDHIRGGLGSGPFTFAEAIEHAASVGARLPTVEELEDEIAKGTGGGYDSFQCWTCTAVPGQPGYVYTKLGTGEGARNPTATDGTQTAYTRYVATINTPTVWTSGNDGAGSGLDADLLDGQQGSYYTDIPSRLGFTPVQQGGGTGQGTNKLYMGWSGGGLLLQVDSTNFGSTWPISVTGDAGTVDGLNASQFLRSDTSDTLNGNLTVTGDLTVSGNNVNLAAVSARSKYSVWNSSTFAIGMDNNYTFGGLGTYAMTFQMSSNNDRGFWWGDTGHSNAQGAMSLTTNGLLTVATGLRVGYGEGDTTSPTAGLQVSGDATITGDIFIEDSAIVFNNDAGAIAKITNSGGDLHLYSDANFRFYESDSTVVRATIDVNNGRMRVGDATNPTNTLEVAGTTDLNGLTTISQSGNQLLLYPTGTQETVIHRNDGTNYYILLSDASSSASETWNALRPFYINNSTGTLFSRNGQDFAGVTLVESLQEDYDALSGTTPTIDADLGGAFSLSTSGNTTFTFSAVTSGRGVGFVLEVTAGGTHTLTWPASVKWAGGTAPDSPASGETNIYVFYTRNGGTTWYGAQSIDAAA